MRHATNWPRGIEFLKDDKVVVTYPILHQGAREYCKAIPNELQYIRNGYIALMAQSHDQSTSLTTPVFHILLALADQERHGYAIMQDVAQQTDGALRLGPGTLYGCIKRMLAAGLITESGDRSRLSCAVTAARARLGRVVP
jgi:hypothetical protein